MGVEFIAFPTPDGESNLKAFIAHLEAEAIKDR
jgi:hypothetical protein